MLYGLLLIIIVLISYIIFLHLKLYEVRELFQETNLLASEKNTSKENYYLKFSIDKDFKITEVNKDTLKYGGYSSDSLIGKSVLGTILEDIPANREMLREVWKRERRHKSTISSKQVLQKSDGTPIPVLLRARPILNELLQCRGISYWGYPLNQQINLERQLKKYQQKDAVVGDILNAQSFTKELDEQVKICNRYNRDLSLIVIELADVYNFVNKGFSFNTGDKLLRYASDVCIECAATSATIGRFDGTKLGLLVKDIEQDKLAELTQIIWENLIKRIRKLNVDKVNAEMVSIFCTSRKRNDSAENMLSRSRKYLLNSIQLHRYGIGTLNNFN